MPITEDRVKNDEIVDITFNPFIEDDSKPSGKGLLDQLLSAADSVGGALKNPLGASGLDFKMGDALKGLVDQAGLGGKVGGFLDRNPFNDLLGLFDYILCMPQLSLNLRLGLYLQNLFKNLSFGFDLKLCGEVINGNPLDAVLNRVKNFNPIDIKFSIETDEWIANALKRTLKMNTNRLQLPGKLSKILEINAFDGASQGMCTLGLTLGYRKAYTDPKFVVEASSGDYYRPKYDYTTYLQRLFYGSAFDTLSAKDKRNFYGKLVEANTTLGDAMMTKIMLQGMGDSMTSRKSGDTAYKFDQLAKLIRKGSKENKSFVRSNLFGKTKMIISRLGKEDGEVKGQATVEYNFSKMRSNFGVLIPNWNLDSNGQENYSSMKNNPFLGRLAEDEMKNRKPTKDPNYVRDPQDPLLFTRVLNYKD